MSKTVKITMQDVYTAYRKFKTYVYYDNSNLLMRNQLAFFENRYFTNCKDEEEFKQAFEEKFLPLLNTINGKANDTGKFFDELLDQISYWVIPKNIDAEYSWKDKDHFITNSIPTGNFKVRDFNILIDAPIELHILSVLWVMVVGKKISRYICKDNYAYKLSVYQQNKGKSIDGDSSECEKLDKGLRLFEPYYKGYQMWRDNALDKALEGLDEHKDAVILSLDITRYYYSARLNVETGLEHFICETNSNIKEGIFNSLDKTFNSLLHQIHKKYALKTKELFSGFDSSQKMKDTYPLPVGLLSSGVLANLYLKDFDEYVNDSITPSYYGRYVDDILMVFIGKKVDLENLEGDGPISSFIKKHLIRENYLFDSREPKDSTINGVSQKNILENGHIYFCTSQKEANRDDDFSFWIQAPDSKLIIKKDKVVMEYFRPHESRAAINNFRKRLQQNSSEYRLLPFEYEVDKEFDEEAFKLDLKDHDTKLRSLQGINEDKYGASKYLAHKIFLSILPFDPDEKDKKYKDTSAEQILTYFRGHNSLCMFTLWEKVATYFLVNNDMVGLRNFYSQQLEAIENIKYEFSDNKEMDPSDNIEENLKKNLRDTLLIGMAMAFSLDPSKIKTFDCRNLPLINDQNIEDITQKLRRSYMFRHQYQYLRGLCFTKNSLDNDSSILGKDVLNKKIDFICENNLAKYLSPVFLRFENIALIKYYNQLGEMMNENSK